MKTLFERITSGRKDSPEQKRDAGRWFDIVAALVLIILASPIMATLSILILITSGRPILYRGKRLGLDKKSFTMYKFRTLIPDAQKKLGARLVQNEKELITPLGQVLRPTRLDELPQLFNVLMGDMQLIGPRPVRTEIYEKICSEIPGYDVHFAVRPGVIGPSQLFTPHGCPKIIRTIIDNRYIRQPEGIGRKCYFIGIAAFAAVRKVFVAATSVLNLGNNAAPRADERREKARIYPDSARVYLGYLPEADFERCVGAIVDINEGSFRVRRVKPLDEPRSELAKVEIEIESTRFGSRETRYAFVNCQLFRCEVVNGHYDYVWHYTPATPLGHFVIHEFFLGGSFARFG